MDLTAAREVAVEAVREAGRLCESVAAEACGPGTLAKEDRSPVTVADFGAQAAITHRLRASFPSIPVVGEEDASALRTPGGADLRGRVVAAVRRISGNEMSEEAILDSIDYGVYAGGPAGIHWTLDPIDGTKGFLRGDQYAVALALIRDGRVVLGVLGCPRLPRPAAEDGPGTGSLFVAAEGDVTIEEYLGTGESSAVSVTHVTDPSDASFCESVEGSHTAHGVSARVAAALGVTAAPYRIDSQCKYAAIARGDASIYLRLPTRRDYEEKIWDHAAGMMAVECAGGRVSDIRGNPLDFSAGRTLKHNQGVIATNGRLHDATVAAVQNALAES